MRRHQPGRGLTAAQRAAHDRAYDECDHTTSGRFGKGAVVADHRGDTWKVVTHGIAYHENCDDRVYGVRPCRPPGEWARTLEIRRAIADVLARESRESCPAGEVLTRWSDGRPGGLANYPWVEVRAGGVVRAVRPVYDDEPRVGWVRDPKLAARLAELIAAQPAPAHLPEAQIREKTIRVRVATDSPRYAAYAAARGAMPYEDCEFPGGRMTSVQVGWEMPVTEYRRIKAALDAADAQGGGPNAPHP